MVRGVWVALLVVAGCGPSTAGGTSFGGGDAAGTAADEAGYDTWAAGSTAPASSSEEDDSGDVAESGDAATTAVTTMGAGTDDTTGSLDTTSDGGVTSVGMSETTDGPGGAVTASADCTLDTHVEEPLSQPELHLVGVYEASGDHTISAPASVHIDRPGEVYLALVSYEQVTWTVTAGAGTTISAVILGGHEASSANAPLGVMIDNQSGSFGGLGHTSQWDDVDTPGIVAALEAQTGVSLTSFAGCYQGTDFTID